jgi:hypothetical protein
VLPASTSSFIPPEFHELVDVAECALDEQLENLQRCYAAAARAASKARYDVELLESRDDIHPHILAQTRRQRAAADRRSQELLRAIDALEDRMKEKGLPEEAS